MGSLSLLIPSSSVADRSPATSVAADAFGRRRCTVHSCCSSDRLLFQTPPAAGASASDQAHFRLNRKFHRFCLSLSPHLLTTSKMMMIWRWRLLCVCTTFRCCWSLVYDFWNDWTEFIMYICTAMYINHSLPILFQGYEGSLLKVTSKNGKTSSVSVCCAPTPSKVRAFRRL